MALIGTHIELACVADAIAIAELSRDYIEYDLDWDYTPERIARIIQHQDKNAVVAREENLIQGFGIMTYRDTRANLDLLAVRLRYRYQGIGRQIVAWLEKVAMTAGIYRIQVQVRETNTGAIRFYEKLGYRYVTEQRGYYQGRENAIIMENDLRQSG